MDQSTNTSQLPEIGATTQSRFPSKDGSKLLQIHRGNTEAGSFASDRLANSHPKHASPDTNTLVCLSIDSELGSIALDDRTRCLICLSASVSPTSLARKSIDWSSGQPTSGLDADDRSAVKLSSGILSDQFYTATQYSSLEPPPIVILGSAHSRRALFLRVMMDTKPAKNFHPDWYSVVPHFQFAFDLHATQSSHGRVLPVMQLVHYPNRYRDGTPAIPFRG
ncbi:uncharacterized protein BO95DRAFT_435477 [Aspergillus brunneoviolaceus CBS 621.78]|uniref:Uncharacterized protein n=1 Tax=Aspergillus brunneoviolaceus CBS 621.78 TaxID=1450534 RepID=A0ACD1FXR1_9EURO|nr:hypothetical protein BO95DRAFT_435477 [Aspergillus brunneoviolaceus CBS 621.78]RAH41755.1 hypothetical protein BO95DRAFT_435477 [Aspergillus brunneoviolaceus CBS 621.78]